MNLLDRLATDNHGALLLDGQPVFRVPFKGLGEDSIQVIGVGTGWFGDLNTISPDRPLASNPDNSPYFLLGSGARRDHSFLYEVHTNFELLDIHSVDLYSIDDLLPVFTGNQRGDNDDHYVSHSAILVVGYGGIRLVNLIYGTVTTVMGQEEYFTAFKYPQGGIAPRPRFRIEPYTIFVDLHEAEIRTKEGKTRNPILPSCVGDTQAEYVAYRSEAWRSMDLGQRLEEHGVYMKGTLSHTLNPRYFVRRPYVNP